MKDFIEGLAGLIGALVILIGAYVAEWLLESWWLMLTIGCMHRNWWPVVPAMGYKTALPIGFFLASFISVPVTVAIATRKK